MTDKYGRFADSGAEYIITTPFTPRPWVNFITNGDYAALCSHVGGGFSFYLDHRYNSVLHRGDQQNLQDLPARLWYIKDEETGEIWTANVHPFGKFDTFEAAHGPAYTMITSSYSHIEADARYFVPHGVNAELWQLQLTNSSGRPRRLSIYSCAEFTLGNVSLEENDNFFMALFNDVERRGESTVLLRKKWWHPHYGWSEENGTWEHRVYMTASSPPVKILVNREAFFGPFRTALNPAALESETLPRAVDSGKGLAGVCQWRIALAPGETWRTDLAIGVQPNAETAENDALLSSLQRHESYSELWESTQAHWRRIMGGITISTPDESIDQMVNHWNKIQALVNFYHGRGPSYYHKGQYQGMRDACQDAFGVIALSPEVALKNIERIACFFFSDGRSCGAANRIGLPEGPADKADLPLWLVLTVSDYLRETGDFAFLDREFPLMDGGSSTVYTKLIAGIDRMIEERGPRGLPLMGKGDWNDAANMIGAGGKGESVWLGQFLYFVISEMAPIMERRGDTAKLAAYRERAEQIKRIVNDQCWDGEWFVRAFRDDGTPVGVRGQEEGYIWINSQTWAVIAQISDPERLNTCMKSVEEHMGTDYGLTNLAPAYTKVDPTIGLITRFRHGWKENGAVFSHASSFNIVARAMLGRGADAVDLFRRILPSGKNPDQYLVEPYIYSQFVAGPSTGEEFGRGAYHWLTGTAAWMLRAMCDYIIGVHPTFDGLRISPAVDPTWKSFSIRRQFRGSVYDIRFENPNGLDSGVREIWLDGEPVAGNILPLPTKPEHEVRVVMG